MFHTFAQKLVDLARGREPPPSGTLWQLLAPFRQNPILGKPVFELVEEIIHHLFLHPLAKTTHNKGARLRRYRA